MRCVRMSMRRGWLVPYIWAPGRPPRASWPEVERRRRRSRSCGRNAPRSWCMMARGSPPERPGQAAPDGGGSRVRGALGAGLGTGGGGRLGGSVDPQAAVEAPRWWSFPGTDPATLDREMELRVEADMPEATVHGLEALGHRVVPRRPGVYDGKVQLIIRDPQRGVLMGASDPRGDGHAAGL